MNNLKSIRAKTGITQAQMGAFMGVSKQAVCNYEKNLSQPPFRRIQSAIRKLNEMGHSVSLDDVFPPVDAEQLKQAS